LRENGLQVSGRACDYAESSLGKAISSIFFDYWTQHKPDAPPALLGALGSVKAHNGA
jgi:hypothetical protein